MKFKHSILALVTISVALSTSTSASVAVSVDFTNNEDARETLYDMWTVANRISPTNGVAVRPGMKVNVVRMIGGIVDKDENGVRTPNLDFDTCTYDEENQEYVYHFDRLVDRIDKIRNGGTEIHQIVLDQPPWAFQRGYTFIPEGEMDGINFREDERVSIYGNSLPPYDKVAYNAFIQAMMTYLISEYGETIVKSWRFRVGSEIETPDHWFGTEQDFIEHFANTVSAVRAVLPDAKIGLHTRSPRFLYKNGTVKNYKNEVIASFADGLIEYCFDNNIRYDFWGISDYPIITSERHRKPKEKYASLFEDLETHPKWRAGTIIDLEEYSVITKISPLVSSATAQADVFNVALTDYLSSKGIDQIFQWGQRKASHENWRTKLFTGMVGKLRYQAAITSEVTGDEENIGAIIAKSTEDNTIDIVLHHYDPENLEAQDTKDINVELTTDNPVGTTFYYRKSLASKEQNAFTTFMDGQPGSSWLNSGFNRYGNSTYSLNETGKAAWDDYVHPNPRVWTEWTTAETLLAPNGGAGSIAKIETQLPLFSYEKIEIKWNEDPEVPQVIPGDFLVGWDQWTTPAKAATVTNGLAGTMANTVGSWAPQFRGASSDGTFGSLPASDAAADTTIGSSSEFHYTGLRSSGTGERSIDFTITEEAGTGFDLGKFRFDIVARGGNGNGTWTLEILDGASLASGVLKTASIETSFDANYLSDVDVDLTTLADSRIGPGESATFRLTISTPDTRSVDLDNVGITAKGRLVTNTDTDGNGLPDAWEEKYFGSKGQSPNIDGDGDGYTHREEYRMGTSPTDSKSALHIEFQYEQDSLRITWNSAIERGYRIYSSSDASIENWTPLSENLIIGTGEPLSFDHTPKNNAPTFYYIQVHYPLIRIASNN